MADKKNIKKIHFLILFATAIFMLLFISCKKNKNAASQELSEESKDNEETELVSEVDFYDPSGDDASWVDNLLAQLEEERIAEELAAMEESYLDYQLDQSPAPEIVENVSSVDVSSAVESSEVEEEMHPVEKFFAESGEGLTLRGKNNDFCFFEFQNEILVPQVTEDGFIISHSADQNASRYFYDLQYHLVKKEEWTIKSARDAKIIKTESFVYSEDSDKVIQKEISTETNLETITYNEASLPLQSKKYVFKDKLKYITHERSWKYNSENKLITDEETEYRYKNDDYKNLPEAFVKRYEYTYFETDTYPDAEEKEQKNEIPPDLKYYENNILKMQYIYTDKKGTYYTWIYFDDTFSVKTNYEDDIKVNEEFYNKGNLFRKKVYDKVD